MWSSTNYQEMTITSLLHFLFSQLAVCMLLQDMWFLQGKLVLCIDPTFNVQYLITQPTNLKSVLKLYNENEKHHYDSTDPFLYQMTVCCIWFECKPSVADHCISDVRQQWLGPDFDGLYNCVKSLEYWIDTIGSIYICRIMFRVYFIA